MKKLLLYLLTGVLIIPGVRGQKNDTSQLRLVFAGDLMGHDTQIEAARTSYGYNYDTCFSLIEPYIKTADIAIANLEVTLAGPPYKGYPQFSSPDELILSAKKSGFDLFINANNHALDRGKEGLERTIDILDSTRIIQTGTFKDRKQREMYYPLIIQKNGIRLAILNYTYGTNGLTVKEPNIVNFIDRNKIAADIEKSRKAEPDFIIVTIHWGQEYQREENEKQRELAEFVIDQGADAIIGSHPHVVQPVKSITREEKTVPVVYSLGNFMSNQRKRFTDGGILFEMLIEKQGEKTTIRDLSYLPIWVYKPQSSDGGNHFVLVPADKDEEFYLRTMKMSTEDLKKMHLFYEDTHAHLKDLKMMSLSDQTVLSGKKTGTK